MYIPSETQQSIADFIKTNIMYTSYSEEESRYSPHNKVGGIRPIDVVPILKKVWTNGVELRRDSFKSLEYDSGLLSSYKRMSNHKRKIASNAVKTASEEYIVSILRVHYFLTFIIYPLSLDDKLPYARRAPVSLDDIMNSKVSLSDLLKLDKIKTLFDTSELSAMHNFNYLRNSLAHSADYLSFVSMKKEYYESIMELLKEIDDIFVWASLKKKHGENLLKQSSEKKNKKIETIENEFVIPEKEVKGNNFPFA